MLMLLLRRVQVLLLTRVLTGRIKQTAKNGMLTEDVLGLLVILVLHITEIKQTVKLNPAVPMKLQIVLESELMIKQAVKLILVVLGQIIRETVLVLMKPPVVLQVVVT